MKEEGWRVKVRERFADATLMTLKQEVGAMNQGLWEVSEDGKGKDIDDPLEPLEGTLPT